MSSSATQERKSSRRSVKREANPGLCGTCIKNEAQPGRKTCIPCMERSRESYLRNFDRSSERHKIQRQLSPSRNMSRMVQSAKKRHGGDITTSDVMQMWADNDGRCALSGVKMTWGGGEVKYNTMSLDRINPSIGYFLGNVRLVCHSVNSFRGQMADDMLLSMAESVVNTMKSNKVMQESIRKAFV